MATSIKAFLSVSPTGKSITKAAPFFIFQLIVFARAVDGVVEDVPDCKELTRALSKEDRRLLYASVTTAIFKYPDSLRYNCEGERLAIHHLLDGEDHFKQKAGDLYAKLDRVTFEAERNGNSIIASLSPWDTQVRKLYSFLVSHLDTLNR
ncbi:unnamed protein product [Cylicostephanus goldi]|uniref:Uncharacterized protein n=1 Tax=Cylicostephanus goldi TaxID=71465 RepID=A0A3P6UWC6_CYLGO|nr:unnamed protein product [Cylicostephanus goldi]